MFRIESCSLQLRQAKTTTAEKMWAKDWGHTMTKMNHNRRQSVSFSASAPLRLLGNTLTLALLLFPLALPSLAAYKRPRNARPPSSATSTSGARHGSAIAQNGLQLTLLAPQQHVGQSQSSHPTFEWFIPIENTLQGEFQLYEITGTGEIPENGDPQGEFQRVLEPPYEFVSEQGFMSFTLPADMAGLKPNTQYIWQVLLRYGPRSSDIFKVRSQIEIVDSATPQITEADSHEAAAHIEQLSEAGLWYDALAIASSLSPRETNDQKNTLILALANLETVTNGTPAAEASTGAELEEPNEPPVATSEVNRTVASSDNISHSEALRQIAEWPGR